MDSPEEPQGLYVAGLERTIHNPINERHAFTVQGPSRIDVFDWYMVSGDCDVWIADDGQTLHYSGGTPGRVYRVRFEVTGDGWAAEGTLTIHPVLPE